VKQADSLPPVPKYAETEEYLHPAGRENEWGVPKAFADAARDTGITVSKSPFVLQSIIVRIEDELFQGVIAGRMTPAQAAKGMGDRLNAEIQLTIGRDPKMKKLYDERVKIQQQIDARRAAGQPVPEAWLNDAFHLASYRAHGWVEKEAKP
jgi:multiple sugar transport system substrate-binding protein